MTENLGFNKQHSLLGGNLLEANNQTDHEVVFDFFVDIRFFSGFDQPVASSCGRQRLPAFT